MATSIDTENIKLMRLCKRDRERVIASRSTIILIISRSANANADHHLTKQTIEDLENACVDKRNSVNLEHPRTTESAKKADDIWSFLIS